MNEFKLGWNKIWSSWMKTQCFQNDGDIVSEKKLAMFKANVIN